MNRRAEADVVRPSDAGGEEQSAGSRIAVISKAGLVLDEMLRFADGATPSEIAHSIGTNRSTTFRLLTSLEYAGLLDRDPASGRYRLGVKLLRYADSVRENLGLVRVAEPAMQRLRDETRQSVYLSVREGWGAVCLHRLAGPEVDVLAWKAGQWLPFHLGAGPTALLAAASDPELAAYLAAGERRTSRHGDLSRSDLERIIAETRTRGWSFNSEGLTEGVASVGAVVRDRSGVPLCAISVAGLVRHYQGPSLDATATSVLRTAARLASQFGRAD
jgi:DNA-binding IclR family transcriptional regulator